MNALEFAKKYALLLVMHADDLPALPERALVQSMALRLAAELEYFEKALERSQRA